MNSLITLTQKPIIDFSKLSEVGQEIQNEIAKYNINDMVVTEETVKDIKAVRAKFNNRFKEYEASRKAIKEGVNDPYMQFEKSYKEHIATPYKEADVTLKNAIDSVENELKQRKTETLQTYFDDLIQFNKIDFIKFEQVGLNITLSASMKSLETKIDDFVHKTITDLELINLEEHNERILVRYKQTLDVSRAIISVKQDIEQEQALIQRKEQERIAQEQVKEVIEPEVVKEPQKEVVEPSNEIRRATFTVVDSIENIVKVRDFMKANNIKFEGVK